MEDLTLRELKEEWAAAGWTTTMKKNFIRFENEKKNEIEFYFDETYFVSGAFIDARLHGLIVRTITFLGWYKNSAID